MVFLLLTEAAGTQKKQSARTLKKYEKHPAGPILPSRPGCYRQSYRCRESDLSPFQIRDLGADMHAGSATAHGYSFYRILIGIMKIMNLTSRVVDD